MSEPRCEATHAAILTDVDHRIAKCHERINGRLDELHGALNHLAGRIEQHVDAEEEFWGDVRGAFHGSPEEHREWHKAVMAREARIARYQDAVIEKSLTGLIWAGLLGLAAAVWHSLKDHLR